MHVLFVFPLTKLIGCSNLFTLQTYHMLPFVNCISPFTKIRNLIYLGLTRVVGYGLIIFFWYREIREYSRGRTKYEYTRPYEYFLNKTKITVSGFDTIGKVSLSLNFFNVKIVVEKCLHAYIRNMTDVFRSLRYLIKSNF